MNSTLGYEKPLTFISEGNQLVGILHTAEQDKLVILCHGFTGNKIENKRLFVEFSRALVAEGFDAFRFDFYGSGDSAGEFEETSISHNIANLIDAVIWARKRGYRDIVIMGISMGAATCILAAEHLDVQAMILWSTVPDMKQVFKSRLGALDEVPNIDKAQEFEGWLIRPSFMYDAFNYDIAASFIKITIPKLVIQGMADEPVFVSGFYKLQEIAYPPADFMEIPLAGHTYQTPEHRKKVIRQTCLWLKRHFRG